MLGAKLGAKNPFFDTRSGKFECFKLKHAGVKLCTSDGILNEIMMDLSVR